MPERRMDQKKTQQFKKRLEGMKAELLHDIKNINDGNNNTGSNGENIVGHGMHMADAATDMYDREFSLNLASNERELLHKIDESIVRLERGEYGNCKECGGVIPLKRLQALPYAETCLKCQEELEKNA
ncbi:MAG: TraR/DksA family transcriptional regulator [Candidatus Omnitrophota bacterium]